MRLGHPDVEDKMPTAESLQDADEILEEVIVDGRISRAQLRVGIALALDTAACRVCGGALAHGNVLDREPSIDRHRCTVAGRRLTPLEWRVFEYLLLHPLPGGCREFLEAGAMFDTPRVNPAHDARVIVWQLRKVLGGSAFEIITHYRRGEPALYELRRRNNAILAGRGE